MPSGSASSLDVRPTLSASMEYVSVCRLCAALSSTCHTCTARSPRVPSAVSVGAALRVAGHDGGAFLLEVLLGMVTAVEQIVEHLVTHDAGVLHVGLGDDHPVRRPPVRVERLATIDEV